MPSAKMSLSVPNAGVLARALQELPMRVMDRVAKSAMSKACRPIVDDMRRRVPKQTGSLAASLGMVIRRYPNMVLAVMGPRVEWKGKAFQRAVELGRKPANYAHLVEFGTAAHSLGRAVDMKAIRRGKTVFNTLAAQMVGTEDEAGYRKKAYELARDYLAREDEKRGLPIHPGAEAKPFVRPAFEGGKAQAVRTLSAEIKSAIEREATKRPAGAAA